MVDKILRKLNKNVEFSDSPVKPVFLAGVVAALLTSILDPLISILSYGTSGLDSFLSIFFLMLLTFVFFLALYLLAILFIYSVFERFFPLDAAALSMSLSFFLALIFILPSLAQTNNKIITYIINISRLFSRLLNEISAIIGFAIITAIVIYIIVKLTAFRTGLKERIASSSLSIPFIFLESLLFIWICAEFIDSYWSLKFIYIIIVFLLLSFSTAIIFRHPQKSSSSVKLLLALSLIFALGIILTIMTNNNSKDSSNEFAPSDHKIRHVILLSVDTLRKDMLSCYGGSSFRTEHIDKLADDGIMFKNAISSSSWTIPAFASIMTGTYPHIHQMTERDSRLSENLKTLAEYMSENGYYTGAIGNNVFLSIQTNNFFQGFLSTDFYPKKEGQSSYITRIIGGLFPGLFKLNAGTSELTDLAIDWVEENREKDFFLWLHYIDPHVPYSPPEEYLPSMEMPEGLEKSFNEGKSVRFGYMISSKEERKWIKGLYEGEVRYVDNNIGRFISRLKELDLYDDSLIVFLSDHGEEFWDHNGFEHGHTLYNELINIPLIIKVPDAKLKGEIDGIVSTTSVTPTILNLCDVAYKENLFSCLPLNLSGNNEEDPYKGRAVLSSGHLYFEERESALFEGYKYIHSLISEKEELYNLSDDPEEKHSLAESSPELMEKARGIIDDEYRIAEKKRKELGLLNQEKIEFDEETKQKLRALGYMN